jgi:glycosyltransferase involved in cell wall biosynthesis
MKKILFVYSKMIIGGSTTSLLSLLRLLDYSRYSVDLLLYNNNGELMSFIPSEVNILNEAMVEKNYFKKMISVYYVKSRIKTLFYRKKSKLAYNQIMAYAQAKTLSRKLLGEYDVAIGFLEFWSDAYVAERVKAKKKIGWIHVDYIESGLIPRIDRRSLAKFDNIVTVSEKCRESFIKCFPELASKAVYIQNILSSGYVNKLAEKEGLFEFDPEFRRIITVCRLSNAHKGLDRGIEALSRLKSEGYKFKWYIVGDGQDRKSIEQQIDNLKCGDCIFLLGSTKEPYSYIKKADIFFLPSRYEGKPMVITEAQMLNVPAIVTEYSSAREQIEDGVDGIVVANNDASIYDGLKRIFDNPQLLTLFKNNLSKSDKSNNDEVKKIYKLIDSRSCKIDAE